MSTNGHPDLHYLVDARWVGDGGPGRVTEHMLRGLSELVPSGRWSIWGPPAALELWPQAEWIPSRYPPIAMYSQREFPGPRTARADVAFYPHQLRPAWHLAPVEVTTIHDTIPFRYPPIPRLRVAMKLYFRRMAALSTVVATDSEFSRRSLMADLGLPAERIDLLAISIDRAFVERVRALRATATSPPVPTLAQRAIFIGRDLPHKNLDRLVRAFARTSFQRDGGELTLVGVGDNAHARLNAIAASAGTRLVCPGFLPQDELETMLATSAVLVQPSLEEGFGLPVAEALAAGIPVAVSSGGSLPEILRGTWPTFDPLDLDAIANGIDQAVGRTDVPDLAWATPVDLAKSALAAIAHALADKRNR